MASTPPAGSSPGSAALSSHPIERRALGAAAAGSGLADLKTVRVLASRETKPAMSGAGAASAAKLAATEPVAHTARSQADGSANEKDADAEAATRILDARRKSVEDIAAGRAARYYLATPGAPASSQAAPTSARKDDDAAKK
jgi:hypothetical protein